MQYKPNHFVQTPMDELKLYTVLAKGHPLLHLTLKTHYEDTFRRQVAPHCLVTPHFPVTPHFGAALIGATLFGDATFVGVTLHRWA